MKLSKSQRVTTIKDIANRLSDDDWTNVDLVLKQFSFPTSDQWANDKRSYIVAMISEAKDDDLVELAEHFGIQFNSHETAHPSSPSAYCEEGKLKVFLSHLTAQRAQASDIKTALNRYGMSSFVAHNDIHPTVEWQIEIETALSTCDLLVALIHPKFVESQWCDQEIGYALGRGVPVFTVRCGADPCGFVSRFQAFNGNGKSAPEIAKELFEASIIHKKLQDKMAGILIDLFVHSGSFAVAKTRIGYLERLTVWDSSYSERLRKALKDNSQVSGSWGVPDQIKRLISKWK